MCDLKVPLTGSVGHYLMHLAKYAKLPTLPQHRKKEKAFAKEAGSPYQHEVASKLMLMTRPIKLTSDDPNLIMANEYDVVLNL